MIQAIVLVSGLSTRRSWTALVARATASRARIPATGRITAVTGPGGQVGTRAGQVSRPAGWLTRSPAAVASTSSAGRGPVTYSRVSPARCSRQSNVSSQVRRSVRGRPAAAQREPRGQRGQHVVLAGLGCPIGRQLDDARERLHRNLCSVGSQDAARGDADGISNRKCS